MLGTQVSSLRYSLSRGSESWGLFGEECAKYVSCVNLLKVKIKNGLRPNYASSNQTKA